ncbi:MAG: sodium:calcium antiporter, partial [Bacteroidetes bacterium]|nr:sodium:calcium antiporter [Bacteroidota bacterium]
MALFLDILFLGGGLLLVIFGANGLVDGASSVAKRYKVSNLVIGLTIVAFGTSAPEMSVSVISAINNNTDLCIGNVVGSNLFNILLILGVTAIILPLSVGLSTISKEIPLALLSAVLLWVFANDFLLDGETVPVISRAEGIAFLAFFAIFIYYTFSVAKVYSESDKTEIKELTLMRSVLYVTLGLAALVGGGKLMTGGAVG